MSRCRRKAFTLMELLVGLSLLTVMTTLLFGSFRQITYLRLKSEKRREKSFQWRYARARLGQALTRARIEKKGRDWFYAMGPDSESRHSSLVFTFDNGVDLFAPFSGMVLGRLYVDHDQRLCLAMWPLSEVAPIDTRMRKEVLQEEVINLTFSFFRPPQGEGVDTEQGWIENWSAQEGNLPAMIRIQLEGASSGQLSFVLPGAQQAIKYYR